MNINDIFLQLSNNVLFKNADISKVCNFLLKQEKGVEIKNYSENEIIISPEHSTIPIGIVIDGTIEITSATQNHKVILKTAGKGAMFGVANLYTSNSQFPSIISAKSNSEILIIDPDIFKELIESDIIIMKNFLHFLSNKVLYLNKKISSYTAGNTEGKLAYYLYENAIDNTVLLSDSLSDIAVMLDMGRASLYRALDKLEEDMTIKREGKYIYIINKEKIKKYI